MSGRGDRAGPILGAVDAMPDFRWTIGEIVIEGERIAARLTDTERSRGSG